MGLRWYKYHPSDITFSKSQEILLHFFLHIFRQFSELAMKIILINQKTHFWRKDTNHMENNEIIKEFYEV